MARDKRPALETYKRFHSQRPTPEMLKQWFGGGPIDGTPVTGLGVICGPVSGGLYCRDFDKPGAYETWRDGHRSVASILPTVQTSRGHHVYARWDQPTKNEDFGNGELRMRNLFTVLPPSVHPSGHVYRWVIHPPTGKEVPMIDPAEAGFVESQNSEETCQSDTERTETAEKTEKTEANREDRSNVSVLSAFSVLSVSLPQTPEDAIALTLPQIPGTRHRQVFKFARALKAVPGYADQPFLVLRPIVKQWHAAALSVINSKDFDETWMDFVNAWKRVQYALGESPMDQLLERVQHMPPPPEAANYDTPAMKLLVALCAELQRQHGQEPFYLDVRTAGRLIGLDHNAAHRRMKMLKSEGLLLEVETGRQHRATRWRWIGQAS
jgi:hypothetical protein